MILNLHEVPPLDSNTQRSGGRKGIFHPNKSTGGYRTVKIALVSCCKTKLPTLAKAKDLYISDSFKKMREYAERNYDKWLILSALHRVVEPDDALGPYEFTLIGKSKEEKQRWANGIFYYITLHFTAEDEIHIFAGEEYRKYLVPMLEKAGYTVIVPLKGLGIGQQKAWLKKELAA